VGGEGTTDLDVYRSDRRALVEQVNKLSNRNAELEALAERGGLTELDAQRARVALHITSSLTLYTLAACFMSGPMLSHTHMAAFIASANLLIWTVTSVIRKLSV
jgi:hypothetical protein